MIGMPRVAGYAAPRRATGKLINALKATGGRGSHHRYLLRA
jgi:hypothetical protein